MRGKEMRMIAVLDTFGITPAHAGKRRFDNGIEFRDRDHPRTCGEKCQGRTRIHRALGSPPHMRGKDKRAVGMALPSRITPAHAGKSSRSPPRMTRTRDHPRTCGEKTR